MHVKLTGVDQELPKSAAGLDPSRRLGERSEVTVDPSHLSHQGQSLSLGQGHLPKAKMLIQWW